jgi:hypothetical protein
VALALGDVSVTVRGLIEALIAHPELLPAFDELETSWLPNDPGALLLEQLQIATARGGRSAVASLVSAEAGGELDDAHKQLLNLIASKAPAQDAKSAAKSVSDCICRLEIAALDAHKRALDVRRGSCTDPAGQNEIEEELQRIASRRHDLRKKMEQV